jgi:hypothetical protein
MEGTKHVKAIEDALSKKGSTTSILLIGQKGKPSTSSKGVLRNQRNLYQWLNSNKSTNIDVDFEGNGDSMFGLLCWGYCSRSCKYSTNKNFEIHNLLYDPLPVFAWVAKPQTKVELKLGCLEYKIEGFLKHRNCPHIFNFDEPFINFICDACSQIPHEPNF